MKLVHAADLHLDSPLRGLDRHGEHGAPVELFRDATRRALVKLVDLCLAEGAAALLLAGDVYDGTWRDYRTGLFFARELARLKQVGTRVFLVRGNHDAESTIARSLTLPDHVVELSASAPETIVDERLGLAVHGQSFPERQVHKDLAARYPAPVAGLFNVGLLHTALSGREGHEPYAPCTVEELARHGYDYWALGHVHAREVLSEAPWIVFPGNLQGRHARETGAKGATVITVEERRIVSVQHRALDVVRWAEVAVDAGAAASADDVVELARAQLAQAVDQADGRPLAVRLVVGGRSAAHGQLAGDPDRWESQLRQVADEVGGGEALWLEKVKLATGTTLDLAGAAARDDAVGELLRGLRALPEDAAAIEALRGELEELRKKLPAELRDELRLDEPATFARLAAEVEELLAPRLLEAEAAKGAPRG